MQRRRSNWRVHRHERVFISRYVPCAKRCMMYLCVQAARATVASVPDRKRTCCCQCSLVRRANIQCCTFGAPGILFRATLLMACVAICAGSGYGLPYGVCVSASQCQRRGMFLSTRSLSVVQAATHSLVIHSAALGLHAATIVCLCHCSFSDSSTGDCSYGSCMPSSNCTSLGLHHFLPHFPHCPCRWLHRRQGLVQLASSVLWPWYHQRVLRLVRPLH